MEKEKKVCVVVLGDIGRSPRMQYHSESFAKQGYTVDIVSYKETDPKSTLTSQPLVSFHYLAPYPDLKLPKLLNYVLKTLWQAITLFFLLFIIRKPNVLLVQNPPAIPAVFVCWIFSAIVRAKYVIDWHNYAHTIMALNVGKRHVLVKLTKTIEMFIGRRAGSNLCVTKEMKMDLEDNWGIRATTLYDRPSEIFKSVTEKEKLELFKKLSDKYKIFTEDDDKGEWLKFTDKFFAPKRNKPGIIVSSTSWTEDEDFSVLLNALQDFNEHIENGNKLQLPAIICVITGKGPLKEFYLEKINKSRLKYVKFVTPWLELEDYPKMLACADLGVCLHTSSSGLDLPMKVVDMFGCALPVCAYNFRCLHELVKDGENSFVFNNAEELAQQLQTWFKEYPNNETQKALCEKFRKELEVFRSLGWDENWNMVALNTFQT